MSAVPSYFNDFLKDIRLQQCHKDDLQTGHTTLRDRLTQDEDLKDIIENTFLQGSYRRSTAVRPKDGSRADVDIIVVTKMDKDQYTPEEALNAFVPFMEKYYAGKYKIQGRSIGINLSYVDLDVVPTAAPSISEADALAKMKSLYEAYSIVEMASQPQWKSEPLYIPDRNVAEWTQTNPLAQLSWTWNKNTACNKHYVNVVKAIKWWKKVQYPDMGHPKSYPLEHLIGQCCPDGIETVADGIVASLEGIVSKYPTIPRFPDHGVTDPESDVFKRITEEEYDDFYSAVERVAEQAREALDDTSAITSIEKWRNIFGSKFPETQKAFTPRTEQSSVPSGRFG